MPPISTMNSTTGQIKDISNPDQGQAMFQTSLDIDALSILLLLGESTIWSAIWSRLRFQRWHWTHMIFATSLGWAPLAGTVFAAMEGSRGPPNLIFDRIPEGMRVPGLLLTNLNSGATHPANHVILQNIWQCWNRGPRAAYQRSKGEAYDHSRECGIVDVNVSDIRSSYRWPFFIHFASLCLQVATGIALGLCGYSFEVLVSICVTLAGQWILLWAVTPRKDSWDRRDLTVHRRPPIMLHKGLESTAVLFIRTSTIDFTSPNTSGNTSSQRTRKEFSLEEYTFEPQAVRNYKDTIKMLAAGFAFSVLLFQIILVGWMKPVSRVAYCALGGLGLLANALEGASQPNWFSMYNMAFSGEPFCEPHASTLMGAVGLLLAADPPAAASAAKLLYPDNRRFGNSTSAIRQVLQDKLCASCRAHFKKHSSAQCIREGGKNCATILREAVPEQESKQIKDAIASCAHFLEWAVGDEHQLKLDTRGTFQQHVWDAERSG